MLLHSDHHCQHCDPSVLCMRLKSSLNRIHEGGNISQSVDALNVISKQRWIGWLPPLSKLSSFWKCLAARINGRNHYCCISFISTVTVKYSCFISQMNSCKSNKMLLCLNKICWLSNKQLTCWPRFYSTGINKLPWCRCLCVTLLCVLLKWYRMQMVAIWLKWHFSFSHI